jgi:hypothetical protein
MPDPYRDLERAYSRIAHRPLPPRWSAEPGLHGLVDTAAVVETVRKHNPHPERSDGAVRALVHLRHRDPDTLNVLLHALAVGLRRRLSRAATAEYRADALGDLTMVILEADDLDRLDRLVPRLQNRAHNRAHKRNQRVRVRGVRHVTTIDPCPPERLSLLDDERRQSEDVAALAIDRAALAQFHDAIRRAISSGELPEHIWDTYRDGRLRRELVAQIPPTTSRQRTDTHRARLRIQPYVNAQLAVHTE